MPKTGGWESWRTVSISGVPLTAGRHVLQLMMIANGSPGLTGNVNWIAVR